MFFSSDRMKPIGLATYSSINLILLLITFRASHPAAAEDKRALPCCRIARVLAGKHLPQPHAGWFDAANPRALRDRGKSPPLRFRVAAASPDLPTRPVPSPPPPHGSLRQPLRGPLSP